MIGELGTCEVVQTLRQTGGKPKKPKRMNDRTSSQVEEKRDNLFSIIMFLFAFFGYAYLWRLSKFVTTPQVLSRRRHNLWLVLWASHKFERPSSSWLRLRLQALDIPGIDKPLQCFRNLVRFRTADPFALQEEAPRQRVLGRSLQRPHDGLPERLRGAAGHMSVDSLSNDLDRWTIAQPHATSFSVINGAAGSRLTARMLAKRIVFSAARPLM
jgi:hypothetical protein